MPRKNDRPEVLKIINRLDGQYNNIVVSPANRKKHHSILNEMLAATEGKSGVDDIRRNTEEKIIKIESLINARR